LEKVIRIYKMQKRGLSTVVASLLVILLVIVAVGVVWTVARNVLTGGAEQFDVGAKCLQVNLELQKALEKNNSELGTSNYSVTMKRIPPGEGDIGGLKLVFFNSTTNSEVYDFGIALQPLQTATQTIPDVQILNANKIEVTVYFLDESGNEIYCQQTSTFTF
jgi:hypothetical protein